MKEVPLDLLKEKIDGYLEGIGNEIDPNKKEEFASSLLYISNLSKNFSADDSNLENNKALNQALERSKFLMEQSLKKIKSNQNLKKNSKDFSDVEEYNLDENMFENQKITTFDDEETEKYYQNNKLNIESNILANKIDFKENNSLISALGNGQILMTSSPKVQNLKKFKSEDLKHLINKNNLFDDEKNLLQKDILLTTSGVGNFKKNLKKSEHIENSNEITSHFKNKLENLNIWRTEEIKEVDSFQESFQEKKSQKESFAEKNKSDKISKILSKNQLKIKDSLFPLSQAQEGHMKSIMSEPTVIIKSSIAVNAEKKFKQVDSKAKLESIKNQFQTKEFLNTNENSFDSSENYIKSQRNNSKLKGSNQMIEEFRKIMESQTKSKENIEKTSEDKVILENIANNTNSSLKFSEEMNFVGKMQNFESFSQKEKGFGDTQKISELEFEEDEKKSFQKKIKFSEDENQEKNSDFLDKSIKTESCKKSLKSLKNDSVLSKNDKLQFLIQKDSEKMSNFNEIDSIDSYSSQRRKENNSPTRKSLKMKNPINLFNKIKKNIQNSDNHFNFKKKKEIQSNDEDSEINNQHSIWNVIKNFSKTTNFIEEKNSYKKFEFDNFDQVVNLRQSENLLEKLKKRSSKKKKEVLKFKNEIKKIKEKSKLKKSFKKLINSDEKPENSLKTKLKKELFLKSPLKSKLKRKILSQSGISSPIKNSLINSPKNSSKLRKFPINSSRKLKMSLGNLNELMSPTLDNSSLLKNKISNFSQKKIGSEVIERLSQPKNSFFKLKNSSGIKGVFSKADEKSEKIQIQDLTETPNELVFDSSLIKLDQLKENLISFQKKPIDEPDLKKEQKEDEEIIPPPNSIIPLEDKKKIEFESEKPKKKKKKRRNKAKTPNNSLISELRHLKPIKREKFIISDKDLDLFYKINTKITKQKNKKEPIHIKKQFKNFFEDDKFEKEKKEIKSPEVQNPSKIIANNFQTWRKESPIKNSRTSNSIQKIIDTPKNIFKDTREEMLNKNKNNFFHQKENNYLDIEFSDKYNNYRNDQNSDIMMDEYSEMTTFTEYSDFTNQLSISNSLTQNDFQQESLNYKKKYPSNNSLKRNQFQKKKNLGFQNQFQSERKNYFKKKKNLSAKRENSWLKKNNNSSSSQNNLNSFQNSYQNNSFSKKSSMSSLNSKNQKKSRSIYEKQDSNYHNQSQNSSHNYPQVIYSNNYPFFNNSNQNHYVDSLYGSPNRNIVHMSKDFTSINSNQTFTHSQISQRPIININLGNNPVENLKIVSVPNEIGPNKDGMTIQLSYTPKNQSKQNSNINNVVSIDGDKIQTSQMNYEGHSMSKNSNIVKSILSKRKNHHNSFTLSNKKFSSKESLNNNRVNQENLLGFQDVSKNKEIESSFMHHSRNNENRIESNFSSKNEDNMMNSNLVDHGRIAEMVQNEDNEIMKVLNNREKMYKITFAESKKSQETKELLSGINSFEKLTSDQKSRNSSVNIYQNKLMKSPVKNFKRRNSFNKRSSISSSKSNSSSTSKYKYVYINNTLQKVEIDDKNKNNSSKNYYEESNEFENDQLEIMNLQDTFPSTIITKEISEISGKNQSNNTDDVTKSHTIHNIRKSLDKEFYKLNTFSKQNYSEKSSFDDQNSSNNYMNNSYEEMNFNQNEYDQDEFDQDEYDEHEYNEHENDSFENSFEN